MSNNEEVFFWGGGGIFNNMMQHTEYLVLICMFVTANWSSYAPEPN